MDTPVMDVVEFDPVVAYRHARADAAPVRRAQATFSPNAFRRAVWVFDLTLLQVCAFVAWDWKLRGFGPHALVVLMLASLVAHLRLWRQGTFDRRIIVSSAAQFASCVPTIARGTLVASLMLLPAPPHDVLLVAGSWTVVSGPALLVSRLALARITRGLHRRGHLLRNIAVYGANANSRNYIEDVEEHDDGFGRIIGTFDDGPLDDITGDDADALDLKGGAAELVELARKVHLDMVVLSLPLDAPARLRALAERFRRSGANVVVLCPLERVTTNVYRQERPRDYAVVDLDRRPIDELQAFQKAVFDKIVAFLALLVLSPLLVGIAIAIRIDSPGPILFRQPRTGLHDRMFRINKFRTMHHAQTDLTAERQTSRDDPRVTRVGRVLRKLSLDELPQLLNVLTGDMSLVGPRPHAPNTAVDGQTLEAVFADYVFRHRVKPGITGWAQVNRARGELRTAEDVRRRVEHDLTYIENWSLAFDIRILLLTVAREILSSRAY